MNFEPQTPNLKRVRAKVSFVTEQWIACPCNYANFDHDEKLSFLVVVYRFYGVA
jgi:hypothetical protein